MVGPETAAALGDRTARPGGWQIGPGDGTARPGLGTAQPGSRAARPGDATARAGTGGDLPGPAGGYVVDWDSAQLTAAGRGPRVNRSAPPSGAAGTPYPLGAHGAPHPLGGAYAGGAAAAGLWGQLWSPGQQQTPPEPGTAGGDGPGVAPRGGTATGQWPALPDEDGARQARPPAARRAVPGTPVRDPWPALPDDRELWVPAASAADAAHLRRLDREQAGG
ncbi:hypothetical protein [Micromonospora sp. NPDC050495]|uniref:hypothetical protein n=1 Tax=Micromonospora sp. NPDC050495 TaxID=3154936 RepID=UPI0034045714